jgi:hypothetical protein
MLCSAMKYRILHAAYFMMYIFLNLCEVMYTYESYNLYDTCFKVLEDNKRKVEIFVTELKHV